MPILARAAQRDLTRGSVPRHVLALAGPAILSTLVHNLYGLNDIYFSKFVGVAAQTAVSNNLFTLIVIFGFVQLASIGTLTLVARRTGAGNEEGADRAARQGLLFSWLTSVVVAVAGYLTAPLIPRFMEMAPDVADQSLGYLRAIFVGLPALFLVPTLDSVYRARGDTRTPLLLHGVAVAANLLGNALAVFAFDAGTLGIGISTVVSRLIWFFLGLWFLKRGRLGIRLERRSGPLLDLRLWGTIARVSAPLAARAALFGSIYQVVSRVAADFGTPAQNGMGVGIRVEGLCFFILVGFGMAAGPIVGQNLGAGKPGRAAHGAWVTVAMALFPSALFTGVFLFLPRALMEVFADDPATIGHGADYLRVISACLLFLALEVVLGQAFVGAGDTVPPMLIDVPLTALRIPLSLWLSARLGPFGIWWAISGTAIARGAVMALWFARGRWKRARPDLD